MKITIETNLNFINDDLVRCGISDRINRDECIIEGYTHENLTNEQREYNHAFFVGALRRVLEDCPQIKHLTLITSKASGIDFKFDISYFSKLEVLDISNCHLKNLPMNLHKLTNLHSILAKGNELTTLPIELLQIKSLKTLCVENNPFKEYLYVAVQLNAGGVELDINPEDYGSDPEANSLSCSM